MPDGWRNDTEYTFAVRPREGGPLIAAVSLAPPASGAWEVGYWTAKEHRGRGYMTEIVLALARWAFTELGCNRLEWRAEVGNTASRAVAEQGRLHLEGTLRGALLNKGTLPGLLGRRPAARRPRPAVGQPYLPARGRRGQGRAIRPGAEVRAGRRDRAADCQCRRLRLPP